MGRNAGEEEMGEKKAVYISDGERVVRWHTTLK